MCLTYIGLGQVRSKDKSITKTQIEDNERKLLNMCGFTSTINTLFMQT